MAIQTYGFSYITTKNKAGEIVDKPPVSLAVTSLDTNTKSSKLSCKACGITAPSYSHREGYTDVKIDDGNLKLFSLGIKKLNDINLVGFNTEIEKIDAKISGERTLLRSVNSQINDIDTQVKDLDAKIASKRYALTASTNRTAKTGLLKSKEKLVTQQQEKNVSIAELDKQKDVLDIQRSELKDELVASHLFKLTNNSELPLQIVEYKEGKVVKSLNKGDPAFLCTHCSLSSLLQVISNDNPSAKGLKEKEFHLYFGG